MTFLEQQTRVGELINQTVTDDTKTVTETEVKAWLNIGYQKAINALISTNQNFLARWADANLVASQKFYALPSDFRKMRRVEIGYETSATRYRATRMDRNVPADPSKTFSTANPVYFIVGDMIELNPTPSINVTDGLRMLYIEDPADLSGDNDVPKLPAGYHYLPVHYAVSKAKQRLGLKTEANDYLAEFLGDIETMKEEVVDRAEDNNDMVIIRDMYAEV